MGGISMLVLSYGICNFLLQAYKFQEDFKSALEGFSQASLLDPGWKEPELQEKRLLMYLTCVADLVEAKVWLAFLSPLQLAGIILWHWKRHKVSIFLV